MSDYEFGSLFETASSSDGEEQAQKGNDEQTPLAGAHAACSSMAVIDTAAAAGVMRCSSVPGLSVLPGFLDKQQLVSSTAPTMSSQHGVCGLRFTSMSPCSPTDAVTALLPMMGCCDVP